jgi:hypothetical protein
MDDPLQQAPGQAPIRRYPRMVAEYVVAYRRHFPDGADGPQLLAKTRTLGLGGLMFETDQPLERDERLRLEVVVGDATVRAGGVVVYVDRAPGGAWQIGVQFTEISEDDRDVLLGTYLQREYRIPPV